jgi:acetylornithine/succinyldiaminopimelate/putrescine aminotransferase
VVCILGRHGHVFGIAAVAAVADVVDLGKAVVLGIAVVAQVL